MKDTWYSLPVPPSASASQWNAILATATRLIDPQASFQKFACGDTVIDAAVNVLTDLANQGWCLKVDADSLSIQPPSTETDPIAEKERVRRQELLKRDEQLSTPSVQRFIKRMEQPREYGGTFVSIFKLMRDGRELASTLASTGATAKAINPYIQFISSDDRCKYTGFRLLEIWRYFRHTWTNQSTSIPGRRMPFLVRDKAAPFHPVIGIAALGSAIVQIRERDNWIGWQPQKLLKHLNDKPDAGWAKWLLNRLNEGLNEIYLDDLIEDGLYWPTLWEEPSDDGIEKLRKEATVRRRDHNRFARRSDFKAPKAYDDTDVWAERARSDLFRSKRCLVLAELLTAKQALSPYLLPIPTRTGLRDALYDDKAQQAVSTILRRAKAEAIGTEIADLTVCGALPPYNHLIGGKLVSMLAVSPTVIREYHKRYSNYASQIASSLAGRPIKRRSNLVYVGTTSLYGSNSSQYNRLRLPSDILQARDNITFKKLGRSRSFGTSHLSNETVEALVKLAEESQTGARINSIFGEGVNPKFRKIRVAFDLLRWPSEELLRHRRPRLIYGVSLVDNLLPYLLGVDKEPHYLFRHTMTDDTRLIIDWWYERWLSKRILSDEVLESIQRHSLDRPVRHGARVALPDKPDNSDG